VPVPDVGTASLQVAVPDDVLVRDVDVLVRLAHPQLADVVVTLRHPDGSSVALVAGPAASGDLFLACFDDEAAAPLAGAVPSAGSFQPFQSLAQLDGKRTFGTWTLSVTDGASGSTGTLGGFALAFDGRTYVSSDVPKPIPDFSAVLSTIDVPHAFTVLDVEVGIDFSHTALADVSVRVQGPGAHTPLLFDVPGFGPGSEVALCALDDEAPVPLAAGAPPYTGRFSPWTRGGLSALDGTASQGTWYLNLQDTQIDDVGTLHGWWLHLVTEELPPPTEPCVYQQVLDFPGGFGFGGDVDVAGERLFVGVPQGSALGNGSGEVQVSERDPLTGEWELTQTLYALGGKGLAHFGAAVAADGERLAVGAPDADGGSGNVTVFERTGGVWIATAEIALPSTQSFGRVVDLVGDRLAVGSVRRADVLELLAGTWTPVLQASGGAQSSFGEAVALAGEDLLVGRPSHSGLVTSAVLVHALDGGPPVELVPSQVQFVDSFGAQISASGDAFASGAPGHDGTANATGIAYVFRRGPSGWVEEAALEPPGLV
ncbi:MAG TPA: proprotein convertase P-domain-containing protein, partial [Planctomycetota bacterium]|nr:proprotein convertase P-domain-containing protein [Planctomycetota bacterium]